MTAVPILDLDHDERMAQRIEVHGTVQGVGFRPFVYRLARSLNLAGTVRNAGGHVIIEATGSAAALADFARRLRTDAPARARVVRVVARGLAEPESALVPGGDFSIIESTAVEDGAADNASATASRDFPPDIATCDDCLAELFDPADRRFRYPFINCTNCGPRATIIDDLPYDRAKTSMQAFPLCGPCAAEYAAPADRRFHAEPVACPDCGPRLSWRLPHQARKGMAGEGMARKGMAGEGMAGKGPIPQDEDALREAVAAVAAGRIVALKGLGGYQLVCDATDEEAVQRLRRRKGRLTKPFAVMVRDLEAARALAHLTRTEEALLTSPARPIVLVTAASRPVPALAAGVCPGTRQIGIFLPYTPLHHLLLHDLDRPLVVTSGNRSEEPIVIDDGQVRDRLGDIADGFLGHDREIRARYDDSVTRALGRREAIVRRARGYAPEPVRLPLPAPAPVLATGAELKHTFTLAIGERALVGPHTGDLEDVDTFDAFRWNLAHLSRLEAVRPEYVAHDLHPGYLSTQYATREWPAEALIPVQHHHAHVASCAAEHGLTEPFIGVAYDGLGFGDDGTLWGGEILIADLAGYRRFGRFGTAPLPGGAAAVRRPARMALGYLFGAEDAGDHETRTGTDEIAGAAAAFTGRLPEPEVRTVRRMIEAGVNSPVASSAGRLFDAASALLGLCDDAGYEGEAAVLLEAISDPRERGELAWRLTRNSGGASGAETTDGVERTDSVERTDGVESTDGAEGLLIYDPRPTLLDLLERAGAGAGTGASAGTGAGGGEPVARLAARFHNTITAVTVAMVAQAAAETGLREVCLSGGVFQNRRLATGTAAALRGLGLGLRVRLNHQVPANDGGISYGQAAVAACRLRRR